jgi:hypothetical protein
MRTAETGGFLLHSSRSGGFAAVPVPREPKLRPVAAFRHARGIFPSKRHLL